MEQMLLSGSADGRIVFSWTRLAHSLTCWRHVHIFVPCHGLDPGPNWVVLERGWPRREVIISLKLLNDSCLKSFLINKPGDEVFVQEYRNIPKTFYNSWTEMQSNFVFCLMIGLIGSIPNHIPAEGKLQHVGRFFV